MQGNWDNHVAFHQHYQTRGKMKAKFDKITSRTIVFWDSDRTHTAVKVFWNSLHASHRVACCHDNTASLQGMSVQVDCRMFWPSWQLTKLHLWYINSWCALQAGKMSSHNVTVQCQGILEKSDRTTVIAFKLSESLQVFTDLMRCSLSLFTPVSTVILCPDLLPPLYGFVTVDSRRLHGVANFSCKQGYLLEGSQSLLCKNDERWNSSSPNCSGK